MAGWNRAPRKTPETSFRWQSYAGPAVVLALVILLSVSLPVGQWSQDLAVWIRDAGAAGVAAFVLAYVVFALFMLPASVLTVGAGFAYGLMWGTVLVVPVSVMAASVTFRISRTVARNRVTARVAESPRFAAIDAAIADEGFRIVALLRLSPFFPFNVLSYVLGLTQVRMRDYVVASFLGLLPSTILYVYIGSAATDIGAVQNAEAAGMASHIIYWGGLVATLVATLLITRAARRPLQDALTPPRENDPG